MTRNVPMVLAVAEERVARTDVFLHRQREIIANLRAGGSDTTATSAVLLELERRQARLRSDRDRLRHDLEQALLYLDRPFPQGRARLRKRGK